jgi:hypothetical protein
MQRRASQGTEERSRRWKEVGGGEPVGGHAGKNSEEWVGEEGGEGGRGGVVYGALVEEPVLLQLL